MSNNKSHQRQWQTYASGSLGGKENRKYNYTQLIECNINHENNQTLSSAVEYLNHTLPQPIYDFDQSLLNWSMTTAMESHISVPCPDNGASSGSLCRACNGCRDDSCGKGYRRNDRSGLCEDINECLDHANHCQYMCENQIGSYRCYCPIGFKMNAAGECQDVDECNQFQIDCGHERTCFNTRGAYECVDVPCPVGYIRQNKTDCMLKCAYRSTLCSHRRATYIRHRFMALSPLIFTNQTLFRIPTTDQSHLNFTTILVDRSDLNQPPPFVLDRLDLKNNQPIVEATDYELEIHVYSHEHPGKSSHLQRRRLHTIFILRINISPFHF